MDEDVLPPPSDRRDPHTNNRIDEDLGLGMPNDGGKVQLTSHDGSSDQVRPEVGDDGLNLRQLRHVAPRSAGRRALDQGPSTARGRGPPSSYHRQYLPASAGRRALDQSPSTARGRGPSSSYHRQLRHIRPVGPDLRLDLDPGLE